MGFDPRRWSSAAEPRRRQTVTSNVDALLAENDSLRRQVLQLKRQLDLLRQRQWTPSQSRQQQRSDARRQDHGETIPSVSPDQVERWGEALAKQQGWNALRLSELEHLIDALNRASFHPHLNLQQRLDRLMPGLGTDLFVATLKPITKKRCAVLAAFALYGIRSREWLDEDPQRVVIELKNRQDTLSISDFDFAINDLRQRRNILLADSDWEVTMAKEKGTTLSVSFKNWRQELRDITNGLTTVEEVKAVVFPTKPN